MTTEDEKQISAKTVLVPRIVELKRKLAQANEKHAELLREEASQIEQMTPEELLAYLRKEKKDHDDDLCFG